MTTVRLISPALRSGLFMATGTGLMTIPFMLGLAPAAVTAAIGIGTIMVALALAGTDTGGRGTLPVSAQAVYDRGLALGLLAVAIVFALAGDMGAMLAFAIAGVVTLAVTTVTRYSAGPAHPERRRFS
jgi:hypothetical protein